MTLVDHYNGIYENALAKIKLNNYEIDNCILNPQDQRRGITVVIKPNVGVQQNIAGFLTELFGLEPDQYYYPLGDLHTTVLSIISCYSGFHINQIDPKAYIHIVEKELKDIPPIQIAYRGISASPSCILIQGFPLNDSLERIREKLRTAFKASRLEHSIDRRYTLTTAHITVVRFKRALLDKDAFLTKIDEYRDVDFGTSINDEIQFVYNDWYQRSEKVELLANFKLG